MKKSTKILVLLLILLSIIILITYTFYLNNKKQIISLETEIKEQSKISTIFEKIYGEYIYEYDKKMEQYDVCLNKHNLNLKKDGTYIYQYQNNCGEYWIASGIYAINPNKIYLYNDNCNTEIINDESKYNKCNKILEFDYTEKNGEIEIIIQYEILEKNKLNGEVVKKK